MVGILDSAQQSIVNIKAMTDDFKDMANAEAGSSTFSKSLAVLTEIADKYDEAQTTYLTTTNPATGDSGYIVDMRKNWKSYTKTDSASYLIYFQRYLYNDEVFPKMKALKSAASTAMDTSSLDTANTALESVKGFTTQLGDFKKTIYDYADQGDSFVTMVQLAFTLYYVVVLCCATAMLLGTVFFVLCGCTKCRCISHFGWFFTAFLMIIGFMLSAVLFPFSVVFIEACDLINPAKMTNTSSIIPKEAWDQVSVCLTGDGDLYTARNLGASLSFATDATQAFSIVDQVYKDGSLVYTATDMFVTQVR